MTKKSLANTLVHSLMGKGGKAAAKQMPGLPLMEGLGRMHEAHSDYQKLREQEKTKRVAILADRDATIEQIRAQRDVIQQALSEAFELRKGTSKNCRFQPVSDASCSQPADLPIFCAIPSLFRVFCAPFLTHWPPAGAPRSLMACSCRTHPPRHQGTSPGA